MSPRTTLELTSARSVKGSSGTMTVSYRPNRKEDEEVETGEEIRVRQQSKGWKWIFDEEIDFHSFQWKAGFCPPTARREGEGGEEEEVKVVVVGKTLAKS